MRPAFLLTAAALASAMALGCADQQQSPTAPTVADPSAPVLSVERGTVPVTPYGFFPIDDHALVVYIGLTVKDLITGVCTGAAFDTARVDQLLVTRPDGSTKQQLKGDVKVAVFEGFPGLQAFCDDPSTVRSYAGSAHFVLNDSDVDLSGRGADAALLHAVGTVTDEGGQRYHLVAFAHFLVAPEFTSTDNFTFLHIITKVKLTPLGR